MTYFDLGRYNRKITTSSAEAQLWFDRGLNWVFGFNHTEAIEDMAPWDKAYTKEMRKLFEAFPDDLDVRAVFGESIMNETPWLMWDLPSGQPAEGAGTAECRAVLEHAFDKVPAAWDHP